MKAPAVTLPAILIVAVGVGATTAVFTVASAMLLRPLPFSEPDRLVHIGTMGLIDFQELRARSRSFGSMAAYQGLNKTLQQAGEPERIGVVAAERELFATLGVQPLAGRVFGTGDPLDVAVVSEGFWRRRFGGIPSPGAWSLTLDGQPLTVVGIMPDAFRFPYGSAATDVWIPQDLPRTTNRFQRIDSAVARLAGDMSFEAAHAANRNLPMVPLSDAVVGKTRGGLYALLGAVAMLLLIACASVMSLLLARAHARRHEIAVRVALGAGRWRVVRQFLGESGLLAIGGGLGAIGIAIEGTRLLIGIAGTQIPRAAEIGPDWRVLLFMLGICSATALVFGVVPAAHALGNGVSATLNELSGRSAGGATSARINKALVIVEIAFAFVLMIGAGLLLRAFVQLERTPTGLVPDDVVTMRLDSRGVLPQSPPDAGGGETPQGRYFRTIEDRLSVLPGVRAAGVVTQLPIQSRGNLGTFHVAGQPDPSAGAPTARLRYVTPGYFRALGIPLRAGRSFAERPAAEDANAILVNDALVRQFFTGGDPIGQSLDRGVVVGVVGDVRQSLGLAAEPEIYIPLWRMGYSAATVVVSAEAGVDVAAAARAAIHDVNPQQAIFNVRSMPDVIRVAHADVDMYLWLIGVFAALALVLSAAGIYAVISYAATLRQKEFGIRLALGADARRLFRLLLSQGGLLIGVGIAAGAAGAIALTRFLRSLLYGVTPTDPLTFGSVALVLVVIALAACVAPAWRVMRLDPLAVLRDR